MFHEQWVRIAEGRTADVFAWGTASVLKLYRPGYSIDEAERAAILAHLAHAAGILTPAVVDVCTINDRRGIVYERIEGLTLMQHLLADPQHAHVWAEALAHLHATIHSISNSHFPRHVQRLSDQIQQVAELSAEAKGNRSPAPAPPPGW